jgi:hypothetical protein
MLAAHLGPPTDEPIPRCQVSRRRRPRHRRDWIAAGQHKVLQMFADRLRILQIMVRVHRLTKEGLFGGAAHLAELQRTQLAQSTLPGLFPQRQRGRGCRTLHHVVRWGHPFGRQLDEAGPMQLQQQAAANHVAQGAIGLNPVPGAAQFSRKPTAAPPWVLGDQTLDERGVFRANLAATITHQSKRHAPECKGQNVERKPDRYLFYPATGTARHSGAATARDGSPFQRRRCSCWGSKRRAALAPGMGQLPNRPCESRFWQHQ